MRNSHIFSENLLKASKGSIYKLTVLAAKRATQIADGDKTLVDRPSEKPLNNAFREIAEGKVHVKGA